MKKTRKNSIFVRPQVRQYSLPKLIFHNLQRVSKHAKMVLLVCEFCTKIHHSPLDSDESFIVKASFTFIAGIKMAFKGQGLQLTAANETIIMQNIFSSRILLISYPGLTLSLEMVRQYTIFHWPLKKGCGNAIYAPIGLLRGARDEGLVFASSCAVLNKYQLCGGKFCFFRRRRSFTVKAGFHMIADDCGSQIAESSAIVCDHMETHFCDRLRSSAILRS